MSSIIGALYSYIFEILSRSWVWGGILLIELPDMALWWLPDKFTDRVRPRLDAFRKHRFKFLLALILFAQAAAYRELQTKAENQDEKARMHIKALEKRASDLNGQIRGLEASSERERQRYENLVSELAEARAARPIELALPSEPKNNRYVAIYKATPDEIVIEFGVARKAHSSVELVMKFDRVACLTSKSKKSGLGPPNSLQGPFRSVMGTFYQAQSDHNVLIAKPSAAVTPRESAYFAFRSLDGKGTPVLQDCRFQGDGESFEEGWGCADGMVRVIDHTGENVFKPSPFESNSYSIDFDSVGCPQSD